MTIAGIDPKCYILALFVRDDGVRFLLGDDPYEFKDKQLHFQPNTVANDVVEVQGNDGYLLAGQVRRPGTQSFDGYVCNGTNSKAEVEVKRREFLQFFRRSHFYKVIYVFPNGTAIQRKQGFLVDDPTVQELYQQYPEYHVALNFEDVNYYTYEEDDQGQEIYAKEAIVPLAGGGATGGLIWDEYGVVWDGQWSDLVSVSGTEIQINNEAGAMAPIQDLELQGDTEQRAYSGKNIYNINVTPNWTGISTTYTVSNDELTVTGRWYIGFPIQVKANTTYYMSAIRKNMIMSGTTGEIRIYSAPNGSLIKTFTGQNNGSFNSGNNTSVVILFYANNGQAIDGKVTFSEIQVEEGSTATAYEPYVGGIPAPNPDYPQAVQTVTGEQTVTVTGKNLFDNDNVNQYMGYFDGTADSPSLVSGVIKRNRVIYIKCKPSTTYSISLINIDNINSPQVGTTDLIPSAGLAVTKLGNFESGSVKLENLTTSATAQYIVIRFQTNPSTVRFDDISQELLAGLQIEQSSTATAYEPYQSQSYPISLGSIELCKIGNYQDYIYKSGDDWYVHKEVRHLSLAIADMDNSDPYPGWNGQTQFKADLGTTSGGQIYTDTTMVTNIAGLVTSASRSVTKNFNGGNALILLPTDYYGNDHTQTYWKTNYPNLVVDFYYGINGTITGTQITDATLIGQLEALGAMRLFIGENNLLVSASGTNLPATLEFSYPTKFAAIGAEWEEGGTKGATIVDVNAIDNTYPVWELTGPAVNPTLSVLTTNTTLTYNGTITASQKLVIDMSNKTATLNGTSMIGNVSGDFVYMAPGVNRIAYTAENNDAPDSTIYWQEVVG